MLKKLALGFFVGLGITVILLSILQSSVASGSEIPKSVELAEQTYQETLLTKQLAATAKEKATAVWMEASVSECMAWKTLAYAKWEAGLELQTPIEEVEHTLCLAPGF